jgi:hypothetical protein
MSHHTFPKADTNIGRRINTPLLTSELAMPGRALSQATKSRKHNVVVEKWMGDKEDEDSNRSSEDNDDELMEIGDQMMT